MVKKFFALKGQDYEEINLDENPEERERIFSISGMTTVPVVTKTIDGEEKLVSIGWNPNMLMQAL
jgi:glutaredoxin